jgi:hypothetical protein
VHLSSHEEADDLGFPFGGPSAPCNSCKVSTPGGQIRYQFFLPEWRKVLHRLHRLACSACLHASQTKVAAASLTEAILGLTRMLQLQAKAKAKAPGTWYDLEMILATKNE